VRWAFKEWAVVVDALGRGEQIFILRKGGIHEGKNGFRMEHSEFVLFPTLFHQQRESVVPSAQARFDAISPTLSAERLRIEYIACVAEWHRLTGFDNVERLAGQHVWRNEVLRERFDWGREEGIVAIALRVFKLASVSELPNLPQYGGCKSWIELASDLSVNDARPVLNEAAFASQLTRFQRAIS
jgi:hypothetical protein